MLISRKTNCSHKENKLSLRTVLFVALNSLKNENTFESDKAGGEKQLHRAGRRMQGEGNGGGEVEDKWRRDGGQGRLNSACLWRRLIFLGGWFFVPGLTCSRIWALVTVRTPGFAHTATAQLLAQLYRHRVQALLPRTDKSETSPFLLADGGGIGWREEGGREGCAPE